MSSSSSDESDDEESKIAYSLQISGETISHALLDPEICDELKSLIMEAQSVIVYRSSPAQKAQVVKLVKLEAPNKKTLAVGDGANDVSMIISADIGVGILSKEGNQASSFADYSMPDF